MEPDILLLDEVLAVGDAEFQKKCLGKMEEVTRGEGRTILFVSHNLTAIQRLCNKTILLENGTIKEVGDTKTVIDSYLKNKSESKPSLSNNFLSKERANHKKIKFTGVTVTDEYNSPLIKSDSKLKIAVEYISESTDTINDVRVLITITNEQSKHVALRLDSHVTADTLSYELKPNGTIVCETGTLNLVEGLYSMEIAFLMQDSTHGYIQGVSEFSVVTDMGKYNYRLPPDKNISDHLIAYTFTQE
jgi:lipopolysaccharide transport system ATP-binding protein